MLPCATRDSIARDRGSLTVRGVSHLHPPQLLECLAKFKLRDRPGTTRGITDRGMRSSKHH